MMLQMLPSPILSTVLALALPLLMKPAFPPPVGTGGETQSLSSPLRASKALRS